MCEEETVMLQMAYLKSVMARRYGFTKNILKRLAGYILELQKFGAVQTKLDLKNI